MKKNLFSRTNAMAIKIGRKIPMKKGIFPTVLYENREKKKKSIYIYIYTFVFSTLVSN